MTKRLSTIALFFVCAVPAAFAQLTTDQKVADFMQLAGVYAKNYAPYEWKRDVIGFDFYNVKPWLDQVKQTKNDLDFYDVCVRYVAALQDSHDEFTLPTDYEAWAHLGVDLYDGKALIDGIDRAYLPTKTYPFQVGDEIVSIDGKTPDDWIKALTPYAVNGSANPVSRQRLALNLALDRLQAWWPGAVPTSNSVALIVRQQTGGTNSYTIPWDVFGTPFVSEGPVPGFLTSTKQRSNPLTLKKRAEAPRLGRRGLPDDSGNSDNPWGVYAGSEPADRSDDPIPDYLQPLQELQLMGALDLGGSISPFGASFPIFNPPTGFKLRLGASRNDAFLSGTYPSGGKNIGFIRIPTMSPASTTTALAQFRTETTFFQQNTDGLVIDVMANGGGSLCYAESLITFLSPKPFRSVAYNIRATQFWVAAFSSTLTSAKLGGSPQWVIDLYTAYLAEIQQAQAGNRGMTGDVPICGANYLTVPSATDAQGNNIAYTKPIVVLTDNFTLSAAEAFTALLQDPGRVTVFGTRTDGGGGNPGSYNATTYSEGSTRATRTFVTRARPVQTPGFPATTYLENVGVFPDIAGDYMTKDNLTNFGKTFVSAFSAALLDQIAKAKP